MKKELRKMLMAFTTIAMVGSSIVGCAGKEEVTSSATGDTAVETEAKKEEQVESEVEETIDYSEPLPADYEGTLTMWGWDDAYYQAMTTAFNEKYPNVKFEYTPMANKETLQKYQVALATGAELPDVAWGIINSRAKVFELDMWEDLSQAPYNFDINDVSEAVHSRMVNSKGAVCGIEQTLISAGMAYRKDLALEYLGTDDPKELEAMFPTWEAFIEVGKDVREKSGGEVYMWPGLGDAQQFIREQSSTAWFDGNTVKATEALQYTIETICSFRDNGIADKLEAYTPAWRASFGEGKHMFTGCPMWMVKIIEANDVDGESAGHWALMNAPEGNISSGGTTLGITKTCKDKRLAWEFIKFATLSLEGAQADKEIGYYTTAIAPYEADADLKNFKSGWFGDQNVGEYFIDEITPNISGREMHQEDVTVGEVLDLVTTAINNDRDMTAEQAMEKLIEELELRLPDYTIE